MSASIVTDFPPQAVRAIVQEVSAQLKERKESVSIVETCAGGIISASLLSAPGASAFYKGGLTLYTLPSRVQFAGWTEEHIKTYKGPSTEVVAGLAENIRAKLDSTYTLCESGTAGPTGGTTPNRMPGYVALAVATERGTYTRELSTGLGGDREGNMIGFTVEALKLLRDVMSGKAQL